MVKRYYYVINNLKYFFFFLYSMDIIKRMIEDLDQLDRFEEDLTTNQVEIHLKSLENNFKLLKKKLLNI